MTSKILVIAWLSISLLFGQGRGGGGRQITWDESLNLTTEQMQQITALRESMQPAMQSLRQNVRAIELELRQLRGSDNAERIAELEADLAANTSALDALMSQHREQIRALLTEEQQLIFDQHEFGPRYDQRGPRDDRRGNNMNGPRGNRPGNGRW